MDHPQNTKDVQTIDPTLGFCIKSQEQKIIDTQQAETSKSDLAKEGKVRKHTLEMSRGSDWGGCTLPTVSSSEEGGEVLPS